MMNTQPPPPLPEQPSQQSRWQKLRETFILWGILAPPKARETDVTEEEQAVRRRVFFQFRRHPGGR